MEIRCIIIDDEPLPVELLTAYAARIPDLRILGRFHDPIEASEFLRSHVTDLIFLDIEMPLMNGIDLLKSLPVRPLTIFTTAYPEFAVDGFELNAVDFLLKPFDFERFRKAVEKVGEFLEYTRRPKGQSGNEPFLFVKSEYKAVKINLSDILYIEGMDSYVKIYAGGKPVLSLMSMKAMLELLPQEAFIRVHRSFIIPVGKVKSIRNKTILIGDKEIPIGGTYEEAVEKIMGRGS